jgi:endoglucanase Acf2
MRGRVSIAGVAVAVLWAAGGLRAQVPVPVGAGSYASYPPATEGTAVTAWAESPPVYLVDTNARPLPTNKWWTDLLMVRYSGNLWAYPFTVSADAQGANLYWPTNWNATGSEMALGSALRVRGRVTPLADPEQRVLADFEGGVFPTGWVVAGSAFGPAPATGIWPGQSGAGNFLGEGFANSFYGGDGPTGTLYSTPFVIDRAFLHFLIGGGRHANTACVNLVVADAVVRSATGSNSEYLTWTHFDLAGLQGQTGRLEVVDRATGGWGHILADQFVLTDQPTNPAASYATTFAPADARALRWGDWTLSYRLAQRTNAYLDVTLGRGQPFVWVEATGVQLQLDLGTGAQLFDGADAALPAVLTTGAVGVAWQGRRYGVYGPPDTEFRLTGTTLRASSPFLVVAALPAAAHLDRLAPFASAIPRDSRFDWDYDPAAGLVTTHWQLDTEPLQPGATNALLGWLPHHLRGTVHELALAEWNYATPRGPLRLSTGGTAHITYAFPGLVPSLPPPAGAGWSNNFSAARMRGYLQGVAGMNYGGDTYWGGKDVLRYAQHLWWAEALGEPVRTALLARARASLADWYTYTPGEPEHFFAAYTNWGGMVGFNSSYGSEFFTDHHFHYGYFTHATALLGLLDPTFLADYGEMATRVARQYANWDRSDTNFPYLRTFDPWAGHSYAGGQSAGNGNNQESTSEAVQSWGGLFLLGEALSNEAMRATGAMGWALETAATRLYWLNADGDLLPPAYTQSVVGILFNGGQAYATYFSGDPGWIHGIQWLPPSPLQAHLALDPAFSATRYQQMRAERTAAEGTATVSSMGASLGNVALGYLQQFDPEWAVAEFEALWLAGDAVANDNGNSGATYYQAHANRQLGRRRWDLRTDVPAAAVYAVPTGGLAVVAWIGSPRVVTVLSNNLPMAHVVAGQRGLLRAAVETEPPDVQEAEASPDAVRLRIGSRSGVSYGVWSAADPSGPWSPAGAAVPGTGGDLWLEAVQGTGSAPRFFQARQFPP